MNTLTQKKIVVAIGGSSGSIYAKVLLDRLLQLENQIEKVGIVMSNNAKYPFDYYEKMDFMAPFASGSARYDTMLICPCSMGVLGRIASGISNDLITRAADVILKERRRLVLIIRDTPYSLIHINNMKTVTEAGGIICPATPSFYSKPTTFEVLAATVIDRVLDLAGFELDTYRWNEKEDGKIGR